MPHRGHSTDEASDSQSGGGKSFRLIGQVLLKLIVLLSLLLNWYMIGLLRHSPGSYDQLKVGGTAAYPGTITKARAKQLEIKTTDGTKQIAVNESTTYALFPKDYQTLIPVGLASSAADIVVGTTEASVSVQLPYLQKPQALRVNLVRDDVATGKVIETSETTVKFKGFAGSGAKEETRNLAANATFMKIGAGGALAVASQADVKKDLGLYAFLDKPASDGTGQITKLIIAEFSTPAVQ